MRSTLRPGVLLLATGLSLGLASCSSKPQTDDQKPKETQTGAQTTGPNGQVLKPATLSSFEPLVMDRATEMSIVLSDGNPQEDGPVGANARPATTPISAAQTAKLLSRLQPLVAGKGDRKDFAKRERSLPAPKTGQIVKGSFPPPSSKMRPDSVKADPAKAVKVLRVAPDGEAPIVPQISVTFDQPMVALTSHADTVAKGVPVKVTPALPEGKWRWVGAKTLLFAPKDQRLPMATEYTATIDAGTKSANGQALAEAKTWTFKTPPIKLTNKYPHYGKHRLEQAVFLEFNQRIEPEKLIEHIELRASGVLWGSAKPATLAQPDDYAKDQEIQRRIKQAKPGTWMVIRAADKLPYDQTITIKVKKGAPSAEGPRLTTRSQSFSFRTYGPLKMTRYRCGWRDRCTPSDQFSFRFSNSLDSEKFDPTKIKVEPSFPTMSISQSGSWVSINGVKPGRRTYKVTFPGELTDKFGQKLGQDKTVSFKVGVANPSLYSNAGTFTVLDASSAPTFTVFSTNYAKLRVRAYKVAPSDWGGYYLYRNNYNYYGAQKKIAPPGKKVYDRVVKVSGEPDEMAQTVLKLKEALGGDTGHIVLEVTPEAVVAGAKMPKYRPTIRTWIQATKIALDGFIDHGEFIAWATTLKDGEPVEGVEVKLGVSGVTAKTNKQGLAKLPLPEYAKVKGADYLQGTKGKDLAMLPESFYYYKGRHSSWYRRSQSDQLKWFVFDDRQMYKPGEEVHLKGWVRTIERREGGGIRLPEGMKKVTYRVVGPRGNEITKGSTDATGLGGFDLKFSLPKTPNLGQARVELRTSAKASGGYHTHYFKIQEFRRPEYKVSTSVPKGPFIAGDSATATVAAKYYAGGALPGAETSWRVQATQGSYRPPNQSEYTFGTWVPWWMSRSSGQTKYLNHSSKTNAMGEHTLKLDLGEAKPPRPVSVRATASVTDVNRQQWSSTATMLIHPSAHYVGMRSKKYYVKKGEPLKVDAIVTDIDGKRLEGRPVKIRAARVKYAWRKGRYMEELVDAQKCDFVTKAAPHECTFKTEVGGTYKITATTTDDRGRANVTQLTRWVSGGVVPPARKVKQEEVTLIPSQKEFKPGDKAKILVQSPFTPAEGVLSIRREGIVETRRFTMKEASTTVEVPITEGHVPNVHVQIDLVGSAPRVGANGKIDKTLPRRPAYARGALNLKVPPHHRKLAVSMKPEREELEPGADTSVSVVVKDAQGAPVKNAEVALIVVDEAILALTGYSMSDPLEYFYQLRSAGGRDVHLRQYVSLVDPTALKQSAAPGGGEGLAMAGNGRGGGGKRRYKSKRAMASPKPTAPPMLKKAEAKDAAAPMEEASADMDDSAAGEDNNGSGNTKIAVRTNFNPLAAFVPAVSTDDQGKATLKFKMPDNLTRYRVMAVAVKDGDKFGHGESGMTARLPLMVRPSAPRFLNFGDKFELPVVLQNQTNKPMTVQVASRATNVKMASKQGVQVTVPANNRVEVRFPASTEQAGTARFQVGAAAGGWSDAAEFKLPVWTPATSEAFATYGVVDKGSVVQPVKMPGEVWTQFGGLQVSTSSTAMQALTDAFLYLQAYPFECSEQISSRVISVAALRDVLSAFKTEGMPSDAEIKAAMDRDIKKVLSRQHWNGGFGLWRPNQRIWPYVSLHVIHALVRAKQKGYAVPDYNLNRAKRYLQRIERHIPHWYGEWTRRHIIAYSLYVRTLMGDKDPAGARALIKRAGGLKGLSFESYGWLLSTMTGDKASAAQLKELRRQLNNRVTETAGAAHFAASTSNDQGYLIMRSNRSADAIILEAMIDDQPKSDLIPKIVKGLMAHRKQGRWGNTQENAFVLLALDKYFRTYEKQTPNFVARVWLGDQFAGEHKFKGRTTEEHQVEIPMHYVAKAKDSKLYLQKKGKGRMYYRLGMTYAPKSLFLPAAEHGFTVQRVYEPVDNDTDVSRKADGTWVIKAGAKVRVKLTMVAPTRRYHVALVDPLPAGLESMNPALAVTGDLPQDNKAKSRGGYWWWWRTWYEHQNMRDERTEAFTSLLWGGVHSYTYYARATTPGNFVVPPAKAEEMYSPETFGRSASDRVIVKD